MVFVSHVTHWPPGGEGEDGVGVGEGVGGDGEGEGFTGEGEGEEANGGTLKANTPLLGAQEMSFVTCQVIETGWPGMPASTEHLSVSPSTSMLAGVAVYVTSKVRMPDGLQTSVMGTRLVGSALHMASTAYATSALLHRRQAVLGAGEGDGLGAGDGDGLGEEGDGEGVGTTLGTLNVN
jgi:hypothetical protein